MIIKSSLLKSIHLKPQYMHIAVDLDDSSLDTLTAVLLYYNQKHGTFLKRENFFVYRFNEVWGGTLQEAINEMGEFYLSEYFEKITPMPDSERTLRLLHEDGHKLSVVTGREPFLSEKTEKCIEKYFPGIFSGIYFANTYGLTGTKMKKSEICIKNGVDLIIDDDLMHISDCVDAQIPVLVYGNPWNEISPKGSLRLKHWNEVLEIIRILSSV